MGSAGRGAGGGGRGDDEMTQPGQLRVESERCKVTDTEPEISQSFSRPIRVSRNGSEEVLKVGALIMKTQGRIS